MFTFFIDRSEDKHLICRLCQDVLGPGRFVRTAYRIRESSREVNKFYITAWHDTMLAGAVAFTSIAIGGEKGVFLLGPLVVAPHFKGKSCGMQLMQKGLREVLERDGRLVLLVGDLSYYSRAGFHPVPLEQIALPGPFDLHRLLAFECEDGALQSYHGLVRAL
ncbi:MAG: N-acetyltransferase [Pseudomonadota bacterium]